MAYELRWTETSLRQMKKLDRKIAGQIIKSVESIKENPFQFVKKLKGFNLYRLRVGDYRVIMSIENNKMIIFVLSVGRRKKIYKRF